jgi:hypothetical protein
MALRSVNLDDRRFAELVESAIARAKQSCPEWTDMSVGDPGRTLLELFAYLTEVMIYRLNRLPEKAYIEFLRLLGVQLYPPAAAFTDVEFTLKKARDKAVRIPKGTRIGAEREGAAGDAVVFVTAAAIEIEPGELVARARAYHCESIEAELAGTGSGAPGQTVTLRRPPVVAPTVDGVELIVAVEIAEDEIDESAVVRRHTDKTYRVWEERDSFSECNENDCVFVIDRVGGVITFAPALREPAVHGGLVETPTRLAAAPGEGREIRVWYFTGGGAHGNVPAGSLTKIKDPVPGVVLQASNPTAATGGGSAETLEHALLRGPQDLHSLHRAVTAADFEALALRQTSVISRARAYTKHRLWRYAPRGMVEVVCIPSVPPESYGAGPITAANLHSHETPEALEKVRSELDRRRPLGTACSVRWGNCKTVRVRARLVVYRQEDREAVEKRVLQRLYDTISPVDRGPHNRGWDFGRPLSAYDVYRILSSEPGVRYVDPVRLCIDAVPAADVSALSPDAFQPDTWYAASGDAVFRSTNAGDGWELIAHIEGSNVRLLKSYPREAGAPDTHAGLIAAIAEFKNNRSRVYLSRDCGETWQEIGARPEFRIEDMAWTDRDGEPLLLLATAKGLYELPTYAGASLNAILVDAEKMDLGFYAVAVSTDLWGNTSVAVAARARGGMYLSTDGGKPGSFKHIGLKNRNVNQLTVQHRGAQRFLWAAMDAVGDDKGTGCSRWQLPESPEGWQDFSTNWEAGGCLDVAFSGSTVFAGTRRHGVLQLGLDLENPAWSAPDPQSGLPMGKELAQMAPIDHLAAVAPETEESQGLIMAAGAEGIFRSSDAGFRYERCSDREFADRVTLPETWLFCSDVHEIKVVHDGPL